MTPRFTDFVAIDWSGQAVARPKGLALAHARLGRAAPALLRPGGGWSRGAVRDWLLRHAEAGTAMLVGLDLSPALPFCDEGSYFPGWDRSPPDAKGLWRARRGAFLVRLPPFRLLFPHRSGGAAAFPPARAMRRPLPARQRTLQNLRTWSAVHGPFALQLLQPGRRRAGRKIQPDRHAGPACARWENSCLAVRFPAGSRPG